MADGLINLEISVGRSGFKHDRILISISRKDNCISKKIDFLVFVLQSMQNQFKSRLHITQMDYSFASEITVLWHRVV